MTKTDLVDDRAGLLWVLLFTGASLATSSVLACMTPFASLAALAALHLRARDGAALVGLAWLLNQFVGYGTLGYPHDLSTATWGLGIGLAAAAGLAAAYGALALLRDAALPVRVAIAFVAAFLAFKVGLTPFALLLGGIEITWSPALMAVQVPREAAILVGLLVLYRLLVRVGVPATRGNIRTA